MGKKNSKDTKVSPSGKPFVSICTPTYNRRKFIPHLIKCFKSQTYPPQLMEWIVVDDGTVYVAPRLTTSLTPTLTTPVGAVSSEVIVVVVRVVTGKLLVSTNNP